EKSWTRYLGAREAFDSDWEINQLVATNYYLDKLKADSENLLTATQNAFDYMKQNGFSISETDATASKQYLEERGLPETEVVIFRRHGFTDEQINSVKELAMMIPDEDVIHYDERILKAIQDQQLLINDLEQETSERIKDIGFIDVHIDIEPRTLHLKSNGNWITAQITIPDQYKGAVVDPAKVYLNGIIPVDTSQKLSQGGKTGEKCMVKFSRDQVQKIMKTGTNEITITGSIGDKPFIGRTSIHAIGE
ncbi:MAG: hypothetical protein LUQ23_01675, partial [Methanomicrobiales archaeon]|nr:hypothetical protein [Methanomicrobiales archaeon]